MLSIDTQLVRKSAATLHVAALFRTNRMSMLMMFNEKAAAESIIHIFARVFDDQIALGSCKIEC